jgi:hypothetical protein
MKKLGIFVAVAAVALFASCTSVTPVAGATGKVGAKVGEATANWILSPIFLNGDAGIQAAAKNGKISTVGTVDVKNNWLYVMGSATTVVTGE